MTDRISVTVDTTRAIAKLGKLSEATRARVRTAIVELTQKLAERVRAKLSGEVLHVRSGALLASIHSEMVEGTNDIYGTVYSQGVPYAAIHEYGGVTSPHVIAAKYAQALRFEIGGEVFFRKSVNHPGSKIPERSYLRSSLAEMQDEIVARLQGAVAKAVADVS